MLSFDQFTGEHYNKTTLKFSFCGSISLNKPATEIYGITQKKLMHMHCTFCPGLYNIQLGCPISDI